MERKASVRVTTVTGAAATAAALWACAAWGQPALYSNGSPYALPGAAESPGLATGAVTFNGTAAPQGSVWSEVQGVSASEGNSVAGFSGHAIGPVTESGYRFADDFVVSGPAWMRVSGLTLFAYQPGATAAPFDRVSVRIWSAAAGQPPGGAGSQLVFGDATTNVLTSVTGSNIYRVLSTRVAPVSPPDQSRRIWRLNVTLPEVMLPPGRYWLDWQIGCVDPTGQAFTPTVTLSSQRGRPGANAMQLKPTGWTPLTDAGKPLTAADVAQELPFILRGDLVTPPTCLADVVGIGGEPPADGQLSGDDFIAFINAFASGEALADLVGIGGEPPADGLVTGDDFVAFVTAFASGCP